MRFIKARKPIAANHKKLGELKFDGEVPQYDTLEEFVQAVGGSDNARDYVNQQVATGAKNVGRAMLRTAEDNANIEELYTKAREAVKSYTPDVSSGASVKTKAEQRDALLARIKDDSKPLTREELLALLEAK